MKKCLTLLLIILVSIVASGSTETVDYSTMTVPELISLLNQIQTEIEIKSAIEKENIVLINDPEGIVIYLNGRVKEGSYYIDEFRIGISIVNESDEPIECGCEIYINGWDTGYETLLSGSDALGPGRKKQTTIPIYLSRTNIEKPYSLDKVVFVELEFYTGSHYSKKTEYDLVTLLYNGETFQLASPEEIINIIE